MDDQCDPAADPDVSRAARGDQAAFERLYRRHVARVHSLVRRLVGGDADDTTQEVFVRAWRALPRLRASVSFAAWLATIARNTALARLTRSAPGFLESSAGELPTTLAAGERHPATRLELEAAVARLPGGARAVLVLHDVEGHTHEEIAAALGISRGTSKSQLHRARMLLRADLAPSPEEDP